jgi:hypothetical protein
MNALLAVILAGASVSAAAQTSNTLYPQACGPQDTNFDVKYVNGALPAVPESGKALVVVIQDSPTDTISRRVTKVGIDGTWAGAIKGISYLFFDVAPGEHHLCMNQSTNRRGHPTELAHINADAGRIYYFRILTILDVEEGGINYGILLQPVDRDQALFLASAHPMSIANHKPSNGDN